MQEMDIELQETKANLVFPRVLKLNKPRML